MVVTCSYCHIRTPQDAQKLIYAVEQSILPKVTDRLSKSEQEQVRAGDVYVWEERTAASQMATASLGMLRFTDGRQWNASRVHDVSNIGPYM